MKYLKSLIAVLFSVFIFVGCGSNGKTNNQNSNTQQETPMMNQGQQKSNPTMDQGMKTKQDTAAMQDTASQTDSIPTPGSGQ